jgi:hypothetical protein
MRYLAPGGASAALLLLVAFLHVPLLPAEAQAQGEEVSFELPRVHGCPGVYAALALAVGSVAATVAGVKTARAAGGWPHWGALARGLGDAGFLVALMWLFFTMRDAVEVVARLGAALTPADIAEGLCAAMFDLAVGCAAALTGLAGSGLVRLCRPAQ